MLVNKRKEFIINAAMALDKAQMIRYNQRTGDLSSTGKFRFFYIFVLILNYHNFFFLNL